MRAWVFCGMMPWDVQPITLVLMVRLEHPDLDAEASNENKLVHVVLPIHVGFSFHGVFYTVAMQT